MGVEDRVAWLTIHIKYCRTTKCYDKGKAKLQWALNQTEDPDSKMVTKVMEVASKHLKAMGAVEKQGMAPMSGLERGVQSFLDHH